MPTRRPTSTRCDDHWADAGGPLLAGLDWSGLEQEKRTVLAPPGTRLPDPFYYVEYGIAQLGAVQVWANALNDQAGAVAAYREALALGGAATLPEMYAAAGARFAFDAETLQRRHDADAGDD